jgi:hypothetical protein
MPSPVTGLRGMQVEFPAGRRARIARASERASERASKSIVLLESGRAGRTHTQSTIIPSPRQRDQTHRDTDIWSDIFSL